MNINCISVRLNNVHVLARIQKIFQGGPRNNSVCQGGPRHKFDNLTV